MQLVREEYEMSTTINRRELFAHLMTPDKPTVVVCGDFIYEYKQDKKGWQIIGQATENDRQVYPVAVGG